MSQEREVDPEKLERSAEDLREAGLDDLADRLEAAADAAWELEDE